VLDWERWASAKRAEAAALGAVAISEVTPSRRDFLQFVGSGRDRVGVIPTIRGRDLFGGCRRESIDVAGLAACYDEVEVAAIAVSTDRIVCGGSLADLRAAAAAAAAPILRDDFLVAPGQLYQSRMHGADAVVLPVGWLADDEIAELLAVCRSVHMSAVLAVLSPADAPRALRYDHTAVGTWGLTAGGDLDLTLARTVAAELPESRSAILLGDVPDLAAWPHLQGVVDAALVAAPLLGSSDPKTILRTIQS
jgi:indole-3-glycerol phosphate synthase